jgi:hypothetical protein
VKVAHVYVTYLQRQGSMTEASCVAIGHLEPLAIPFLRRLGRYPEMAFVSLATCSMLDSFTASHPWPLRALKKVLRD